MSKQDLLSSLSPLPIVNLAAINTPSSGLIVGTPEFCRRAFEKDDSCRQHYQRLAEQRAFGADEIPCPHGFASRKVSTPRGDFALTGFIPYPRLGGKNESARAKSNKKNKIASTEVGRASSSLQNVAKELDSVEQKTFDGVSAGLHEIRKLNREVKQTAERMCLRENRDDPTLANPETVKIWKASEMMSTHFNIIELVANETLMRLPVRSRVQPYRLFDKCARIYRPAGNTGRISLHANYNFQSEIAACDKTISIIPTVLIQNAIKYSPGDSEIVVEFSLKEQPFDVQDKLLVEVTNECSSVLQLDDSIFGRSVRIATDTDGSGFGLYVAQQVAIQHKTKIQFSTFHNATPNYCRFGIEFDVLT
ncbi:ATP-binding protein [Rhodopirellula sp. P2]|uniref:ATP-binding protein n=1 Tax=Rhodopirellula sp. P2 TaxID=2127060 RepID=UPI00236745E4|nr:ATP-binding protein [Rhodopirellula sp. P2]WDQ14579.1 hypothetical protein PSR62_13080 [Rhodopirellula sp. P2]